MTQATEEIGAAQPGRPASDHRHSLAGVRPLCHLDPLARVHLPIRHEALEHVDRNRIVLTALPAPAPVFTRVRANPSADEDQGVSFLQDAHRFLVVPPANGIDVRGNVDLGRASLPAGREAFVLAVQVDEPCGVRDQGDDPLGARLHAGAAGHALLRFEDRQPVLAHLDRSEPAGLHTAPEAEAADPAVLLPSKEQVGGPAVRHPVVEIELVGPVAAGTGLFGQLGLLHPHSHAHDRPDLRGHGRPTRHADIGRRGAGHDRLRGGATSRKPASSAVRSGQSVFHLRNPGVFLDVEDAGSHTQTYSCDESKTEQAQERDGHCVTSSQAVAQLGAHVESWATARLC